MTTREEIRAKILATHTPKSVAVELFGTTIELRQPILEDVIKAQSQEDRTRGIVDVLIKQAYVPDTNEKVFTEEDADQLCTLPMGADILRVAQALESLTEVNFLGKKNGSNDTPSS